MDKADAGSATTSPAKLGSLAGNDEGEISDEVYLGVVKSYNDRRGFGFLACAETAAHYGRDVYMPKAEATQAAAEAAAGGLDGEEARVAAALAAEAAAVIAAREAAGIVPTDKEKAEKPPPAPRLAEEDVVLFRVRLSIEGYPQAACVKKLRKLTGVVTRLPPDNLANAKDTPPDAAADPDAALGIIDSVGSEAAHALREVPWPRRAAGQVRLAIGDEVTFCVPNAPEAREDENGASLPMEAKMISLSKTSRNTGSVLGCFTLDLPRTGAGEDAPPRSNLLLDCHAFGDKLILAGLPGDLEEAELMRFFSKQGASQAIVARAKTCSFASVSFPGTLDVAKFLGRTSHAFADDKETRIAKLIDLIPNPDAARLPALPAPTLAAGEEAGALLVVWSPLVLAVGYAVELRPAGGGGDWVTVDVASSPGDNNRFDSACSSCKVAGLNPSTVYEARVSYFTECGTRSEASEASEGCLPMPGASAPATTAAAPVAPTAAAPTMPAGFGYTSSGACYPPPLSAAPTIPGLPPTAPPVWPSSPWLGPDGLPAGVAPPPLQDPFSGAMPAYIPPPGWRSATGMVVPPPPTPELRPADEHGFAVSIQWPAVVQAAAYVVELREAGSSASERFVRAAPEAKLGTLVELRVGGLRPGPAPGRVYCAQVRTVGADGSESAPSPLGWSPPLPSLPSGGGGVSPSVDATAARVGGGIISTTPPAPSTGSKMSADAMPWQPSTPTDGGTPVGITATTGSVLAAPSAPPPSVPPPAAPPSGPCLGGWAPPPWLSPPGGSGGPALGSLGPTDVAADSASRAGGLPPSFPPRVPEDSPPLAPGASSTLWGAPGAPPPPPAGPPALGQTGQRREDPAPETVAGLDECLILD